MNDGNNLVTGASQRPRSGSMSSVSTRHFVGSLVLPSRPGNEEPLELLPGVSYGSSSCSTITALAHKQQHTWCGLWGPVLEGLNEPSHTMYLCTDKKAYGLEARMRVMSSSRK